MSKRGAPADGAALSKRRATGRAVPVPVEQAAADWSLLDSLLQDRARLEGALRIFMQQNEDENGQLDIPTQLSDNFLFLVPFFSPTAQEDAVRTPRPGRRIATPRGSRHADIWVRLAALRDDQITIDGQVADLLDRSHAAFFADCALPAPSASAANGRANFMALFTYTRQIRGRNAEYAVRQVVMALVWHAVAEGFKPPTQGPQEQRTRTHWRDEDYEHFHRRYVASSASADTPGLADFQHWFDGQRALGFRYQLLSQELGGEGALFPLITHFTEQQLAKAPVRSDLLSKAIDHLRGLGLNTSPEVRQWSAKVRDLKAFIVERFPALF